MRPETGPLPDWRSFTAQHPTVPRADFRFHEDFEVSLSMHISGKIALTLALVIAVGLTAILGIVIIVWVTSMRDSDIESKLQAHDWSCLREDGGDNGTFSYSPSGIAQIFTTEPTGARSFKTYHYSVSDNRITYTWEEDDGTVVDEIEALTPTVLSTHQISGRTRDRSSVDFTAIGPVGATRSRCVPVQG
jgi:hypothetical protein